MRSRARFAFAQARMQARHGRRPPPHVWERLERIDDFGRFVQSAQTTGLRAVVQHIGSDTPAHRIEGALRDWFRADVAAVAAWHPVAWRPALAWVDVLPDLPVLGHLLDGGPAPPWLARDRRFHRAADVAGEVAERAERLDGGRFAPLVDGWRDGLALPEAWRREWRRLWPPLSSGQRRALDRLERLFTEVREGLTPPAADAAMAAGAVRERVERALHRLFRHQPQSPAASFAHLGLCWLDLQRLRGDLLRRRLLPEV